MVAARRLGRPLGRVSAVIVVGATTCAYKCDGAGEMAWLDNAETMIADQAGTEVRFFAALELDARGHGPFMELIARLDEIRGQRWDFSLDDGAPEITSRNRLSRICMGRNLITEYAQQTDASHILYLDTDTTPPGDVLSKLLEVDRPLVSAHVPSYCHGGPEVDGFSFPVQEYPTTAGCLLVRRDLFRRLRWRWDLEAGMVDDPCYSADAVALGARMLVRRDVIAEHPCLVPVEDRPADRTIHR